MCYVIKLIEGLLSPLATAMFVNRFAYFSKLCAHTASHGFLSSVTVSLELIYNYLRNKQFNPSPVAYLPKYSDHLPAISLLCKVKPDARIYKHVDHAVGDMFCLIHRSNYTTQRWLCVITL